MKTHSHLDYADAQRIVNASIEAAASLGLAASIAVLDPAGHLVLLARMDGASFQTPDVARGKALTSAMMKKPSSIIETATLARLTLASFDDGRLPIQGGLPVFSGDQLVGAVGVSGGTPDQDEAIARAGIDAWTAVA
ncbi:GlcG/HbpS family heme-binding protein [Dickeya zeae]|uniref:GlcG/HbpS family heme-binding protein n=1 Tax=Dickeya zeae TaxID=204042 RepID=UPI0003A29882|nr:heme-binding protein [Dickeya zeae]